MVFGCSTPMQGGGKGGSSSGGGTAGTTSVAMGTGGSLVTGTGGSLVTGTGGSLVTGTGGSPLVGTGGSPLVGTGGSSLVGTGGSSLVGTGGSPLVGTGGSSGAVLTLDKSTINLGTLDVGGIGIAVVTVTNIGRAASGPITVTASSGLTATGCAGILAAGASCTLTIAATATAAGALVGAVAIAASPGTVSPLTVSVLGTVSSAELFRVSPPTIDLGNVAVGALVKQTIAVTAKAAIADLVVTTSGADVTIDKVASTCANVLAAGASCMLVVNFVAATAGVKSDSIIVSGGGAAGKVVAVPVTAVAQIPAKLIINPSTPQSFVGVVGQTSSAITFGVANTGDIATGVITATLTGDNAASFAIASSTCLILAPLAACTIGVVYKPMAVAASPEKATLIVTESGGGSSVSVALSGAQYGDNHPIITPANSDLGTVLVGATGPATTFTLTNAGDTASGMLTVSVSSTEFVITNDTCSGASLAARTGSCTVAIALAPKTVGAKTATLMIDDATGNPAVKTLTGTGVSPASPVANPTAIDFGSVQVGKTSLANPVTVKNNGGMSTGTLSITKAGSYSAFSISDNTCTAALAPGASCGFKVTFAPTAAGSVTASFTITDGTVSASVNLAGTGTPGA
jgi:hypothetical protein